MGTEEAGLGIGDVVYAELVDCTPPAAPEPDLCAQPTETVHSPTEKAAAATIEQTGADPPPVVTRG